MIILLYLWVAPPSALCNSETITDEDPRLPLAMKVFLKKPHTRQYVLHIHLANISGETVKVDVHDLPWSPPNDSRWLVVSRLDRDKSPLQQLAPKWDIGSQKVPLLPGESIQGELALNPRIPSLLQEIEKYGILLHWDCPPPSLKFVCAQDAPQSITIPKGDPGTPDLNRTDADACHQLEKTIGLIDVSEDHQALFLHTQEHVIADLPKVQSLLYQVDDYVRQCQPSWTNSWAVNFFSDAKFAGFLSDMKNERYFEEGLWQKANIGQYSSQIRTLYRFPWSKKRSDTVYLSVYR
ncbi:MAG: hypothetical protein MRJ96_04210 [Nitrospirales bacterium]|nr:hypothetical protein [Nitrospira sp.]MDR4500644.1 hypothetical protein [Nitrospirales bacterium]